VKNKDKI